MWNVKNKNSTDLTMCEGDYGIEFPFTFEGFPISTLDTLKLTVKKEKNGDPYIEKEFTVDGSFTIQLSFTEEESAMLTPGTYIYILDWYSSGVFMCNMVNNSKLKVEDKA